MSFRRRKSRIGPSFQAIIPAIYSKKEKEELLKLYDYEQSLSAHCLTLSSLSNKPQSATINHSNPTPPLIRHPFGINDTSIDHKANPICFEIAKSHKPQNHHYANYVQRHQNNAKLILINIYFIVYFEYFLKGKDRRKQWIISLNLNLRKSRKCNIT